MPKSQYETPVKKSKFSLLMESYDGGSTRFTKNLSPVKLYQLSSEVMHVPKFNIHHRERINPFSKKITKKLEHTQRLKAWRANHLQYLKGRVKQKEPDIDPRVDKYKLRQLTKETIKLQNLRPLMTKSEYECDVQLNGREERERKAEQEYEFQKWEEYYERHMQ